MKSNDEESGFEEDSENDILVDEVKSNSVSRNSPIPESVKEEEVVPPIPLVHSGISLEPDMLFGWKPKSLMHGGPIPLNFTMDSIPAKNCIFNGYRPEDTLELHETFSNPSTYSFTIDSTTMHAYKVIRKKMQKKDQRPFVGMKNDLTDESLVFDSKFESGNLDKVAKVKEDEYDLYIRSDSNTYGKNQWFYFEVTNKSEEKHLQFNIVNFSKPNSLYTQGLQPCVFRESFPNKGWHYISENVKYTYSKINKSLLNNHSFYCLSFNFVFPSNETLKFAYSMPYSYSDLCRFLKQLENLPFVKHESLCKSLSGVKVPMLTITSPDSKEKKEVLIVTARVHPGESHGSWVMKGFLEFIIGSSMTAIRLRHFCVFKIVPMLNPDGVIIGNSRCSANGQDLNRQFQSPDLRLHPEIYYLKNLIHSCKNTLAYLDFHAHSKKKGIFIYGPHYPLHSEYHCKIRVIPKLLSENTESFRYYSCKFRNDWSKRKAARLVISRENHLPFSYTVETSSFGYLDSERNSIVFDAEYLQKMGQIILHTILQYIDLRNDEIRVKQEKAEQRQKRNLRGSPVKEYSNKRTMEDILEQIKKDMENEDNSDSGGSNSDAENEQEEHQVNKGILNILKQVNQIMESPVAKRYSNSQAPKMSKNPKKIEEFDTQAKSTLAKYFSRASTDNKNKFKCRTESVRKSPSDFEKKNQRTMKKIRNEGVSKFSYAKGLYALKPRTGNIRLEKGVLQNRRDRFKIEPKEINSANLGIFMHCIDGYESNSEGESPKRQLNISAIMKNNKYNSAEKIN